MKTALLILCSSVLVLFVNAWITTNPDGSVAIMGDTSIGLPGFTDQTNLDVLGSVVVGKQTTPGRVVVLGDLQCNSNFSTNSIVASGILQVDTVQLTGFLSVGEPAGITTSCSAATEGQMAYHRTFHTPIYCDGSTWRYFKDGSVVGLPPGYGGSASTPGKNCLDIYKTAGARTDGIYWVKVPNDTSPAFQVFCDMTGDDGGWTLVYRDSQDGIMQPAIITAQGTLTNLLALEGPSAKFSDIAINGLKTYTDNRQTFRVTSPNITTKYYVPGACVYAHVNNDNAPCRQITPAYSASATPLYLQCSQFGTEAGGINAWYLCQPSGGYTNMVITHRRLPANPSVSAMTDNPYGATVGAVSSEYPNKILVWVR